MNHFSVPWFNESEWLEVYDNIYSPESSLAQKLNALKTLQIWKSRTPLLPSGIEATLSLLGVELQRGDDTTEYLSRLAYSTAIMRFINHTVDSEQAKGLSILKAAIKLGIPRWVINLRHETAHGGNVPPLKTLIKAAGIAMDWLLNNYWTPQCDMMCPNAVQKRNKPLPKTISFQNELELLIPFYTTCSVYLYVFKINNLSDICEIEVKDGLIDDVYNIQIGPSNELRVLLAETLRKIKTNLRQSADAKAYAIETLLFHENDLMLSVDALNSDFNPLTLQTLPWQFVGMWEPLLSLFHVENVIEEFIERLSVIIHDQKVAMSHRRVAALWLKECFHALLKCKHFESVVQRFKKNPARDLEKMKDKELKSLLIKQYPHLRIGLTIKLLKSVPANLTNIHYLSKYLVNLNPFTEIYLEDVFALAKPNLPNDCKEKMRTLLKIMNSDASQFILTDKVYSVNDIRDNVIDISYDDGSIMIMETEDDVPLLNGHVSDVKCVDLGVWSLGSDNIDWAKCFVGALPWQSTSARNPLLPVCGETQQEIMRI